MKFKEGKILETFCVEKNGKKIEVTIRYPKKSDLRQIWKFYNKVIKETEFLPRITPVSLSDERKWLAGVLDGMRKNDKIQIFAEYDGRISGSCSIERRPTQRHAHIAGFGICILQEFTGMGLGKRLMREIEKEALKSRFKIVELSVYGRNKIAQSLYRKMGFKAGGKVPKAVKIRHGFDDDIKMFKVLKK